MSNVHSKVVVDEFASVWRGTFSAYLYERATWKAWLISLGPLKMLLSTCDLVAVLLLLELVVGENAPNTLLLNGDSQFERLRIEQRPTQVQMMDILENLKCRSTAPAGCSV